MAASTLAGTAEGLSFEGAWTGAPLWWSSDHEFSAPSLVSFEGAGSASVPVDPGVSQVVVSGSVFRRDSPLAPRVSEALATSLNGLDSDLVTTLTEPSVESYSRYSGLVRYVRPESLQLPLPPGCSRVC